MIGTQARSLACAVGLVFAAIGFAACLDTEPPPKPTSNWTIFEARQSTEFPLYWLGASYQELQLTSTRAGTDGDGVHHATFAYGEPSLAGSPESQSWLSPLEVDIQPYCGFNPEEAAAEKASFDEFDIDNEFSIVNLRGVDAYLFRFDDDDLLLYLWTGNSTIELRVWKATINIEQAARDLIPISEDAAVVRQPLSPPTPTGC